MNKRVPGMRLRVSQVCRRLKMSRQNYYRHLKVRRRREVEAELFAGFVRHERRRHPRMGCRKLLYLFRQSHAEAGAQIGRDRAFQELKPRGLLLEPKRAKPKTTGSSHRLPVEPNRIRDLEATEANQIWVSDLTYIQTQQGFMYLSLTTDQRSRKILGHTLAEDLKTEGCLRTAQMALAQLPAGQRPIHHSDRGCQYASHAHRQRLEKRQVQVSMTEKNHCAENAMAERINGILKQEYELDALFATNAQARRAVNQAV